MIGEEEKRAYLKTLIDGTELASEDQGELISSLLNEISYVKGELLDLDIPIYKVFVNAENGDIIREIWKEVEKIPGLAVASSFFNNLELTDEKAQKGPAILKYTQMLGYQKEDVMVLGDSLNDLSMFQAGFGAAVAMGNAHEKILDAAGYVTRSNDEDGAAFAMRLAMEDRLEEIKKVK